jgi:hypothetical protein
MPPGPSLIFDKSSLESLNLDEAVLTDNFYMSTITPLFFVECLADLDKQTCQDKSRGGVGLELKMECTMKLVVKTGSLRLFTDPDGFKSSDRCAPVVGAFCGAHGLPYSETFVSIAVVIERRQSPLKAIGKRRVYNLNDEFGQYAIELNDDVIKDIEVVTVRDFQTVICAAIQVDCGDPDGRALSKYLQEKLIDLRGKTVSEKRAALEGASRRAPRAAYAEARVFRFLRSGDKRPTVEA